MLFTATAATFFSCKEDDPPLPEAGLFEEGFFILNEGNFGTGNSSLDFFHPDSGMLRSVYAAANGGLSPGDVLQSMVKIDDRFLLVLNNSGKILSVSEEDASFQNSLEGLTSPRYILSLASDRAYVSDLFANEISIFNPTTMTITGTVPTGGWSERMVRVGNFVYAAMMTRDRILRIDAATNAVVDSFDTGREPEGLLADDAGNLYILGTGGFGTGFPEIRKVQTPGGGILQQWIVGDIGDYVNDLGISPAEDYLYWLGPGGVYRMSTTASTPPDSPWLETPAGSYWYALEVDREGSGEILIGDAKDFVSQGEVLRYSAQGTLLDQQTCGISPGSFYFVP